MALVTLGRIQKGSLFVLCSVNPGMNAIAVALEDHGGSTAFDMQVSANAVPVPGALVLCASAIAALGSVRRRATTTPGSILKIHH